jgi:hypothetical protein
MLEDLEDLKKGKVDAVRVSPITCHPEGSLAGSGSAL